MRSLSERQIFLYTHGMSVIRVLSAAHWSNFRSTQNHSYLNSEDFRIEIAPRDKRKRMVEDKKFKKSKIKKKMSTSLLHTYQEKKVNNDICDVHPNIQLK